VCKHETERKKEREGECEWKKEKNQFRWKVNHHRRKKRNLIKTKRRSTLNKDDDEKEREDICGVEGLWNTKAK
jgi:hypothetical protein